MICARVDGYNQRAGTTILPLKRCLDLVGSRTGLHKRCRTTNIGYMGNAMKRAAVATTLVLLAGAAAHTLYADVLQTPVDPETQTSIDEPTDAEIRDLLVQDSIERYTGNCACPYHRKWNEKLFRFPNNFRNHPTVKCGTSSEYIRPGGPTVLCFGSDVPAEMVEAYREHLRSTFLTEPQPQF